MRNGLSLLSIAIATTLAGACGEVIQGSGSVPDAPMSEVPVDGSEGPPDGNDAPVDQPRCDLGKPFGTPKLVENVNSPDLEVGFTIARGGTLAIIERYKISSDTSSLLASQWSATTGWSAPNRTITSATDLANASEYEPSLTANGLELYFESDSPAVVGPYVATRADARDPFNGGSPVLVNGQELLGGYAARISADGQTLYWIQANDGVDDEKLIAARRTSAGKFQRLGVVTTMKIDSARVLSPDELTLYYQGVTNGGDVLVSTRTSKDRSFGPGEPVPNVNSSSQDWPVAVSDDGCELYLSSDRPGGAGNFDIWLATRPR